MRQRLLRPFIAAPVLLAMVALGGCVGDASPRIGAATAGDGWAVVSWQPPPAMRKPPVTAYVVTPWIGFERQAPVVYNSTATTQTVTGLTNGVTYGFTVHAVDADGNDTSESNMSNRVTPVSGVNVVPNPNFEQGGCGQSTPVICGWYSDNYMSELGPPGGMELDCGVFGCYSGGFGAGISLNAQTDPAFCAAIGPGPHPASFSGVTSGESIGISAYFYQGADCTTPVGSDGLDSDVGGVSGVLVAPPGTQSALFSVFASAPCEDFCFLDAFFYDLDVEDTVIPIPAITSFTPAGGLVGATVDVEGWNFTGATSVAFNGTPAAFTIDSNSEIHATVPSGAATGPISVTTPLGTAASKSTYTVTSSLTPAISSFTPWAGHVGTNVDIRGWNFTAATSVAFNSTPAAFELDSDSEIHATVPSGATDGSISVTTPSGTATGCCFSVPPPPSIDWFDPASGSVGTSVNIQGENLSAATSVTFNGTLATFTVDSGTNISAIVPNGATTGPISVTTPEGSASTSTSFTVI